MREPLMPRHAARTREQEPDPCVPDGFSACPIDAAFAAIGKKWSLLVLRNLLHGDRRFNELLFHIDGLNPKTLSQRLKEMELEGLVQKRVTGTNPVQIEYSLTPKGADIFPILRTMAWWSFRWAPEKVFEPGHAPPDLEACLEAWQRELLAASGAVFGARATWAAGLDSSAPPARGRRPRAPVR